MSLLTRFLREHWPFSVVLIACALAFALDQITTALGSNWIDQFLMVPAHVSSSWQTLLAGSFEWGQLKALTTLVSYALLHADVEHIFFNLLFLWVFGTLVLRELGAVWFFVTFIVTAMTGGIGQVLLEPHSMIPVLGASGAVMGFEGIYFGMALRWRLPNPDIWPLSQPVPQERLMIFAALGIIMDMTGMVGGGGSIAHGAHIGGFIGTTLIPIPKNAH